MEKKYVLAIDQGTTSSRAVLFDSYGREISIGQREFRQIFPLPGYVEHDPEEIFETTVLAMREAVESAGISPDAIASIGITNQRETTVAWDRETGEPACNAIVWQCRRTASICEELKSRGLGEYIGKITGLIIDPYFSGTKMKWMLENLPRVRELAGKGRLCFGTVDSWLIYRLTGGDVFATDVTNACRTMLFDIRKLDWDETLLKELGVSRDFLPKVVSSSEIVGYLKPDILGKEIPISGVAGDQHAALFGQCCFSRGMAKNTYGTGCFVLMNTGENPVNSGSGLLTTIAWKTGDRAVYALEGSAFNAGSAIKWLRDELKLIESPQEADYLAETVEDSGGLVFVPAFTGLGAPYWDAYARGALLGITRGATKAHVCRAVLESIALESWELVNLMEKESGVQLKQLRVDGGASRSRFLMQEQADLLSCEVLRPKCLETTALGAAMLAGLGVGVWKSEEELAKLWDLDMSFIPNGTDTKRQSEIERWHKAVERSRNWEEMDRA